MFSPSRLIRFIHVIDWFSGQKREPNYLPNYDAGHRGNGLKYTVCAGSPRSASTIGLRLSITKFLRQPTKFEPCWRRALPATYMLAFGALRSSFVKIPGVSTIPEKGNLLVAIPEIFTIVWWFTTQLQLNPIPLHVRNAKLRPAFQQTAHLKQLSFHNIITCNSSINIYSNSSSVSCDFHEMPSVIIERARWNSNCPFTCKKNIILSKCLEFEGIFINDLIIIIMVSMYSSLP